jgi:hypothetical protein
MNPYFTLSFNHLNKSILALGRYVFDRCTFRTCKSTRSMRVPSRSGAVYPMSGKQLPSADVVGSLGDGGARFNSRFNSSYSPTRGMQST